jgi:hypothetical protein
MVDFPDRLVTKVEAAFGADPAGDPALWTWTDLTERRQAQSIVITRGRQNEGSTSQPSSMSIVLDNLDGALTPDLPTSPYYPNVIEGTPLRFSLQWEGAWYTRFVGNVGSWAPSWPYGDLSNAVTGYQGEATVTVTANGVMRRLGQGSKPLKDALRRHIDAHGPLAYWPLTDGETAIQGTEVIGGGSPLRSVGEAGSFFQGQPNWGKGTLASWLDPVVELPAGTTGYTTATISTRTISAWSIDHVVNSRGQGNVTILEVYDTGAQSATVPLVQWQIDEWGPESFNQVQLRIVERLEDSSSAALLATIDDPGIYDGGVHHLRLSVADDGAGGLTWELYIDGVSAASGNRATVFRPLGQVVYRWSLVEGGDVPTESVPFGHLTYWGENPPTAAQTWQAVQGHIGERAGRRIERLCTEQSVALAVNGNLDQTPPMGPQRAGAFLDLLQTAVDVDSGVLYESRRAPGLEYRTLRSKYNQGM